MQGLRSATPAAALAQRNEALVARLSALPLFRAAKSVALFASVASKQEPAMAPVDTLARAAGKAVYYPFMDPTEGGFRTGFRLSHSSAELAPRGRGFPEPPKDAPEASRGDVELVLVPALAATPEGHRLGYGAGWYDVTLPDLCPPATALMVVFDFQVLGELPQTERDFRCDGVLTDARGFGLAATTP